DALTFGLRPGAYGRPVGLTLFVHQQIQPDAIENDVAHAQLATQQRQHLDAEADAAHVRQRLLGLADRRYAHLLELDTQPREERPADVTAQGQLDVGLLPRRLLDLLLVVVGVEQAGKEEQHPNRQD